MDAVKRTRLDPCATAERKLIDLGARMLAERPLEQISVEDIADQAGVSRGLLFHYFASKSEFHLAIVRHSSEQMLQRTEPSESDDPMLTLRSVLASYVDYVTENRNTYVSLLRGTASGDPQMREVFEQTRDIMAKRTLDQLPEDRPDSNTSGGVGRSRLDRVCRGSHHQLAPSAPAITREELIDLTVQSLPALALAAVGFDAGPDLGLLQSN